MERLYAGFRKSSQCPFIWILLDGLHTKPFIHVLVSELKQEIYLTYCLMAVKLGLYVNKMKGEMKFMRKAGYTHLDCKKN
jgi:hypothetical protein